MKRWKREEKRIAQLLGGTRMPNTGAGGEDVSHDVFSGEVKSRKVLPKWLWDALDQSIDNSPEGKIPILTLHQVHSKRRIVVMDLDLFLKFISKYGVKLGSSHHTDSNIP